VKTRAQAKEHFRAATAYIPARYKEGVAVAEWQGPTLKAADNYYSMMSKVITEKLYDKGVSASSDAEWRRGASEKGAPIIGTRIAAALDKWDAKWGPMFDTIRGFVPGLPPRGIDPLANVDARLKPIVSKWRELAGK